VKTSTIIPACEIVSRQRHGFVAFVPLVLRDKRSAEGAWAGVRPDPGREAV